MGTFTPQAMNGSHPISLVIFSFFNFSQMAHINDLIFSIYQFSPGSSLLFPILLLQTCRILMKDYTLSWNFSLPDLRRQLGAALCLCLQAYSMGPVVRKNSRAFCNYTESWNRTVAFSCLPAGWSLFDCLSVARDRLVSSNIHPPDNALYLWANLTPLLSKSIQCFLSWSWSRNDDPCSFFFLEKYVICAFTNCMTPPCRTQFGTSLNDEPFSDITFSDTRRARSFLFGVSPFRTRSNLIEVGDFCSIFCSGLVRVSSLFFQMVLAHHRWWLYLRAKRRGHKIFIELVVWCEVHFVFHCDLCTTTGPDTLGKVEYEPLYSMDKDKLWDAWETTRSILRSSGLLGVLVDSRSVKSSQFRYLPQRKTHFLFSFSAFTL